MEQRIVIKVAMHCDKCRSKAMKIAVVSQGVTSVSIEGECRDQVVVVGDGVDSVCLTNKLRKKFPSATLVTVEDVKPPPPAKKPDVQPPPAAKKPDEQPSPKACTCLPYYCQCPPPCSMYYPVVYDPYPDSCSIL